MLIVLFEIRARPDVDAPAYEAAFQQMLARAQESPGFVAFDAYSGEGGVELAVARFEDDVALARWRDDPEHVLTRRRGHDEFFDAFDITVATVGRRYGWVRAEEQARST